LKYGIFSKQEFETIRIRTVQSKWMNHDAAMWTPLSVRLYMHFLSCIFFSTAFSSCGAHPAS